MRNIRNQQKLERAWFKRQEKQRERLENQRKQQETPPVNWGRLSNQEFREKIRKDFGFDAGI